MIGILLLSPLILFFWFPTYVNYRFYKEYKHKMAQKPVCLRYLIYFSVFILSLILNVLAVPLTVLVLPFLAIRRIKNYCKARQEMKRNYQRNLDRKFGLDMNDVKLM